MEYKQNNLERQQSRLVVTKAKQLPDGQFEAVLSTDDLDRHGERVSIKGMTVPKNQVIKMYYNHQTNGDALPIGKWLRVWKSQDGNLMGRGEIDLEDDFAVKVYKKVQKGIIDSISIGFYPKEFDGETTTWTQSELVEASVVAEPANVHAVITSKELGFTPEEFKESLKVRLKEEGEELFVGEPGKPPEKPTESVDQDKPQESDNSGIMSTEDLHKPVDNSSNTDTDVKAAFDELKSRVGAVEQALKSATERPAIVKTIRVRLAAKQVDQAAENLNRVLRVKLKETN